MAVKRFSPFLFFLLSPFLLLGDAPFVALRYALLALLGLFIIVCSFKKYDLTQLGFLERPRLSHLPPIAPTLFLALLICALKPWLADLFSSDGGFDLFKEGSGRLLLPIYYVLVSVPFQQLFYRSFLVNFLEEFRMRKGLILLAGAALFALVHVGWGRYVAFGAFWLGLYWVWLFMKTRSFWPSYVSHVIVGSGAVFLLGV